MESDIDKNTEQVTADGYELNEAIENKDIELIRTIKLKEGRRREDRRWKNLYNKNGLKSYSQTRFRYVGTIAAIIVFIYMFSTWKGPIAGDKWAEIFADLLIMAGTFFAASGVVLNRSAAKWLGEIVAQEENIKNNTRLVREASVTRDLMALVRCIQIKLSPSDAEQISTKAAQDSNAPSLEIFMDSLRKRLKNEVSGRDYVYVISQKDLAKVFLDASQYSLFGTMMILAGTAGLAMLALHR